MLVVD